MASPAPGTVASGSEGVTADDGPITYSNLDVSPTDISFGDTVTVTADLENTGSSQESYTASLVVDGEPVAEEDGTLEAGTQTTVSFQYTPRTSGDHEIGIETLGPETVAVENAWTHSGYDLSRTRYNPDDVAPTRSVTERWTATTGDRARSSPMVVDGVVYTGSWDGTVYAFDADTGTEIWNYATGDAIYGDPAVADGVVYVGSEDSTVYALDATDGSRKWKHNVGNAVKSSPVVADGTVYIGSEDTNLYAIDTETGKADWVHSADGAIYGDPTVHDDVVYAGDMAGTLYALEADSGTEVWSEDVGDSVLTAPAVANERVHVVSNHTERTGSQDHRLAAYDAATGDWEWTYEDVWQWTWSSPAIVDDRIFVSGRPSEGVITAVDATTGTEDTDWSPETDVNMGVAPGVAGETIVFGDDNYVYGFDTTTGDERWRYEAGAAVEASPTIVDETVYTGSDDGTIYALEGRGEFAVTITETHGPVAEDEPLYVDVDIENIGGGTATDEIALSVDTSGDGTPDEEVDSAVIRDLESGATTSTTLTWETGAGDEGTDIPLEVVSGADVDTGTVTVTLDTGLRWSSPADWSQGTHDRTVSDDVGVRENDTVRLGYDPEATGLVSYWPLDETSGDTAVDVAGRNDGTHVDGPTLGQQGLLDSTAYGFADEAHVTDEDGVSIDGGMSVSTWVKTDSLGENQYASDDKTVLVQSYDWENERGFALEDNGEYSDELHFMVLADNGADGVDPTAATVDRAEINDGEWHHIVGVQDGEQLRLYVDGELRDTTDGATRDPYDGRLTIGAGDGGWGAMDGDLDEVQLYDYGLSDEAVSSLYETTGAGQSTAGTHTTAWRAPDGGEPLDATTLALENVDATIDDAHDVTATVEVDHDGDGTADEVSDSITLDEATSSYAVDGITEDSSRFRLHLEFDTTSSTTTPVISRTDIAGTTVTPFVTVSDFEGPQSEIVGETIAVSALLENTGSESVTQSVDYRFDGITADTTEVTLAGGESQSVAFTPTIDANSGTYTHGIYSEDDDELATIDVLEPANFEVTVDDTDTPVVEGEALSVDVEIANTGEAEATQTVALEAGGSERDSQTVTLAGGERTALTLEWATTDGDAGEQTITVASADESVSETVTIEAASSPSPGLSLPPPSEPEPRFDVAIEEATDPVAPNETLAVVAAVENRAHVDGDGELAFLVDGTVVDTRTVSVANRERERETFTDTLTEANADEVTVSVRIDDATDSQTVTIAAADPEEEDEPSSTGGSRGDSLETNDTDATPAESPGRESPATGSRLPAWTDSVVDYDPSPQTQHVGGFLWLTGLVSALGGWLLLTRETRASKLLAATLLLTGLRTSTDVVHALLDGLPMVETPLAAINLLLEIYIAVAFVRFAARYANAERLIDRRATRITAALVAVATAVIATNPLHELVFVAFVHVSVPFAHVGAELGPVGWLIGGLNACLLLTGGGLVARSFLAAERPTWRPVGVIALGVSLALLVGALGIVERGPLPHYDYTAAGVASFMLVTTATLLGHGLHRVKSTAQRSLLEELDDAIVVLDDAHTVVEYNGAARRLLPGLESGRQYPLLEDSPTWPEPGESTIQEVAETAIGGAMQGAETERESESESANRRHYLVQTTAVGESDTLGYTVRFADVTDIQRQAAALERKNEQLDQFASTVSHDLRNPLSVAAGYVELLSESTTPNGTTLDRETMTTYLEHVDDSLERMRAIIDDILALARGSEAVTETASRSYEATVRSAWEAVDTRDAALTVETGGQIEADHDRLQRLLENLVRNSIEHASPDVSIVTGLTDDGFYVADDGPGIPPDERDAVFEHGYSGTDGTGFGLAIVDQLADAHGWRVRLDGDHDGARFVFTGCETTLEGIPDAADEANDEVPRPHE